MSTLEPSHVVGSNPIIPEKEFANSDLSSSQNDYVLLNVRGIVAVTAHEQTENKSSSIMNAVAPHETHHSVTNVSDGSNYRDSLLLSDMSYLNDSYVPDETF